MSAKKGYLWKQSMHLKKFRKRWTVLKRGKLLTFARQTNHNLETNATEIFDLTIYNTIQRGRKSKNYEFQLISRSGDTRVFAAKSIDDMIAWMIEIEQCQNKVVPTVLDRKVEIEIQYRMEVNV